MKKTLQLAILTVLLTATAVSCANPATPVGDTVGSPSHRSDSDTMADTTGKTDVESDTTATPDTEVHTTEEPETNTDTSTEPETTPSIPDDSRSFHFPLLGNDDTTSYISLPDMEGDGKNYVEFFIVPTDTEDPVPTSAYQFRFPKEGETNILVLAATTDDGKPSVLLLKESTYMQEVNGEETRFVGMMGDHLWFNAKQYQYAGHVYYYFGDGGGSAGLQYTEAQKEMLMKHPDRYCLVALSRVEKLLAKYTDNDSFTYKFTILYSYVNGVETINTPVDSIPEFTFDLFKENAFLN